MFDLSKIEAGRMELTLARCEVAELVDEVGALVEPLLQRNANHIDIRCDAAVGAVLADRLRLRQVLLNLLGNAAKFTHGGLVGLRVEPVEAEGRRWIDFAITDSGIGITDEQLGRLFQDFSQAEHRAPVRRHRPGPGLEPAAVPADGRRHHR